MPTIYLFQTDMKPANDAFFEAQKLSASYFYGGLELKIGYWIPDLIKISVDDSQKIVLTIIELESEKIKAVESCRQYLPEKPTEVVRSVLEYLARVIRDRFHPHRDGFVRLKTILEKTEIAIFTEGHLRSSTVTEPIEGPIPLIDQPKQVMQTSFTHLAPKEESPNFRGEKDLSADDAHALKRSILVLDAVIRNDVHNATTFAGWRRGQPQKIKKLLKEKKVAAPYFSSFLFEKRYGSTVRCEELFSELVAIWSTVSNAKMDQERVRGLIESYFPVAVRISSGSKMPAIFQEARKFLADGNNPA